MASSNSKRYRSHWPSMFKSKPAACRGDYVGSNTSTIGCEKKTLTPSSTSSASASASAAGGAGSGSGSMEERIPERKARWNPKKEQIRILEAIFDSGKVNPTRDEILKIRAQLQEFGQVGDASVFYWFQNRKSRNKHKQRQQQQLLLQIQPPRKTLPPPPPPNSSSEKQLFSPLITNSQTSSVNQPNFLNLSPALGFSFPVDNDYLVDNESYDSSLLLQADFDLLQDEIESSTKKLTDDDDYDDKMNVVNLTHSPISSTQTTTVHDYSFINHYQDDYVEYNSIKEYEEYEENP